MAWPSRTNDALDAYVAGMNNPPKPVSSVQKGGATFGNKSFEGRNVPKKVSKVTTKLASTLRGSRPGCNPHRPTTTLANYVIMTSFMTS